MPNDKNTLHQINFLVSKYLGNQYFYDKFSEIYDKIEDIEQLSSILKNSNNTRENTLLLAKRITALSDEILQYIQFDPKDLKTILNNQKLISNELKHKYKLPIDDNTSPSTLLSAIDKEKVMKLEELTEIAVLFLLEQCSTPEVQTTDQSNFFSQSKHSYHQQLKIWQQEIQLSEQKIEEFEKTFLVNAQQNQSELAALMPIDACSELS
ncbi:MAG: hypothetical protein DGJ47_000205 [Rickettsiaceae bacterium]